MEIGAKVGAVYVVKTIAQVTKTESLEKIRDRRNL
jgi:hypothetical protein